MSRLAALSFAAAIAMLIACDEPTRVTSARPSPDAPPLFSPIVGDPLFTELPPGDIPCQDWLYAGLGISNTGYVAGFVQVMRDRGMFDDCTGRGAVWDPDGNVRILEPLDGAPSGGTIAHDVDDAGNVVGDSEEGFGVLWTASGPAFALAPLPGDGRSGAAAISDVGQLIVGWSGPVDQSTMRAVLWTGAGAPRALAPVSGPGGPLTCSRAHTVNDRGDAAGYAWECAGGPEYAVLWPRAGGAAIIADQQTRALDINEGGEILGFTRAGPLFVWTPGADAVTGTLRHLPVPNGALHCDPLWVYDQVGVGGIDDFGNAVGICTDGGPTQLVVWTSEGGMTVLPPESGFFIKVNDRGQIAGAGVNDGVDGGIWRIPFAHPNRAPSGNAGGPYAGSEGTPIAFDGRASFDPDREALSYEWNFTGARDASGALIVEATGATPSHAYANQGTYTVTLTVVDARGARSAPTTAGVTVDNAPPTATFAAPASVNEGSPIVLSLTGAHDPSPADAAAGFSYAFDCADGTGYSPFGAAASRSCATVDNEAAPRAVGARIRDRDGGVTTYVGSVTILNVAPKDSIVPPADTVVAIGKRFTLTGGFSDVGINDAPWRVEIDWDVDDPASPLETATVNVQGPASAPHVYTVAKTYRIRLSVTDKDGAIGLSNIVTIVACDPKIVGKSCR